MAMASNTNTNTNSNLFGGDTDSSSDDSASAADKNANASSPHVGEVGGDRSSENEEPNKESAKTRAAGGVDGASSEGNAAATDGADRVKREVADGVDRSGSGTPSKNTALFGDDDKDESSEDDEFDGDDGIVGRSGGGAASAPVGKSMNEKLGLESDSDEEKRGAKPDEDNTEKNKPRYIPPRRMELLDLNLGSSSNPDQCPIYHITKLPNLVGIQTTPYSAGAHNMEEEEKYYRGYVHNMIRWRYKTDKFGEMVRDGDGNPLRESNTRLVKWSDGSYTLHVGQEVLEVDNLDSSVPTSHPDEAMAGFAAINGYVYVRQQARIRPASKREVDGMLKEGEEHSRSSSDESDSPAQPAGTVLECIGPVASRLSLRPSSLASDAHRNLKLAVQKRNVKRARIAEIVTEVDPEKEKQARIKGKEDLAKSNARRSGGGRRGGGGGRRRMMNEQYLEEDEGYDDTRLGRIKTHTMGRDAYSDDEDEEAMDDYGESEEEEEEKWITRKKKKRGALAAARAAKEKSLMKSRNDDESSEEGEVVFGDDEEDDEEDAFVKKRGAGGTKKSVFDDDDDD